MSSSYRLTLENWLKTLDIKANKVLDIGGSQLNVKGRTKSWDVDEYLIADLPNPHKDSPKPDIEIDLNLSGNTPTDLRFDLIFCLEVFDYVYDPMNALKRIANTLADNGTAWITFQSIYPHHQPVEDDALRYMPGGIKKLAESAGLKIQEMIPRFAETDAFMDFCRAERLRAAKGFDHRTMGYIVRMVK